MADKKADQRKSKRDALVNLYEESYSKVARYIFVRIGDQQEAEDLASETFVKALQSLDSYEDRGMPMEAWIFRIAHNLLVDHLRKASKSQTVNIEESLIRDPGNPEELAETNIEVESLLKALENLSQAHREVIALRFFSGFTSVECGRILGKKPGAVREMQSAAVKLLRQSLDRK